MPLPRLKFTRAEWQRHALVSAWRGVAEPPMGELPVKTPAELLEPIMKKCGLRERVQLEEVLAAWREIVGDFLFQHSCPDSVSRGVLKVRLMQPSVHHALMMEKPRILARLKAKLGHVGIREVRFSHG